MDNVVFLFKQIYKYSWSSSLWIIVSWMSGRKNNSLVHPEYYKYTHFDRPVNLILSSAAVFIIIIYLFYNFVKLNSQ